MTGPASPVVEPSAGPFSTVCGIFYRAVDPKYREFALSGSRAAGRFSPPATPALYLSSSREGVTAAMIAHTGNRARALEVLPFEASQGCTHTVLLGIALRDAACACEKFG